MYLVYIIIDQIHQLFNEFKKFVVSYKNDMREYLCFGIDIEAKLND
jgi:hypothetical protein